MSHVSYILRVYFLERKVSFDAINIFFRLLIIQPTYLISLRSQ
jgi:hypothetical protein